jgi:hypothetical protein
VALCPPPARHAALTAAAGQLAWGSWAAASPDLQPWQHAWALPGGGAVLQPAALLQDGSESSERRPRPLRRGRLPAASSSSSGSQLGVQLNDPPPRQQQPGGGPGGEERDKDFFANVGDAIRTLREDYPLLFAKELNYAIYREDLVFKDPQLSFRGLRNYKLIFWSLRFHGRLFLQAANVQVLRIWQPQDDVIKLRWQISARTRMGTNGTFDGISVYRLDRHGRVYQHEVTDVQLRDPPVTNPLLYALNFVLSPRPQMQQVPCPGSWYTDGEPDLLPDALAASGGSGSSSDSGGEVSMPVPVLVVACHPE